MWSLHKAIAALNAGFLHMVSWHNGTFPRAGRVRGSGRKAENERGPRQLLVSLLLSGLPRGDRLAPDTRRTLSMAPGTLTAIGRRSSAVIRPWKELDRDTTADARWRSARGDMSDKCQASTPLAVCPCVRCERCTASRPACQRQMRREVSHSRGPLRHFKEAAALLFEGASVPGAFQQRGPLPSVRRTGAVRG
jgi:hypothetical protein